MKSLQTSLLFATLAFTLIQGIARAQYPKVSKADGRKARAKTEAMNRRSDEAWERALPTIEAWAKKGKPYLPAAQ